MIEKISLYNDGKHIVGQFNNYEMGEKINELVDAVNVLQAQVAILKEHAHPTATTEPAETPENRKCAENAHDPIDDEVREEIRRVSRYVNSTPAERYKNTIDSGFQDQFAEQRKWIGHLVEHNTPDNDSGYGYGILTAIYPGKVYPFEINGGEYYAHSVRLPRADILYGIG